MLTFWVTKLTREITVLRNKMNEVSAGNLAVQYQIKSKDECGIEKVPATYDELKDAAGKTKAKGYVCVAAGAADDWIMALRTNISIQLRD